jgi:hypothetical protein
MQRYAVYFIWKLLYMFRVVPSPIIRSQTTVSTASGICHTVIAICRYRCLSVLWVAYTTHSTLKPVPTLPRKRQVAITVWQIPDAVDTVVWAPDNGWCYHPKHVEQFPDKIHVYCVMLHLVGYILEYYYNSTYTANALPRKLWKGLETSK